MSSPGERHLRVLSEREGAPVDNVSALVRLDEWRVRRRRARRVAHYRQRLILDRDLLQRILRTVAILRRNRGYRLAYIANLTHRQAVCAPARRQAKERGRHPRRVGTGNDRRHPRQRQRTADIDASDTGVRVGRAQNGHVQHAGHHGISDKLRLAGEQVGIFFTFDRPADPLLTGHRCSYSDMATTARPATCPCSTSSSARLVSSRENVWVTTGLSFPWRTSSTVSASSCRVT